MWTVRDLTALLLSEYIVNAQCLHTHSQYPVIVSRLFSIKSAATLLSSKVAADLIREQTRNSYRVLRVGVGTLRVTFTVSIIHFISSCIICFIHSIVTCN